MCLGRGNPADSWPVGAQEDHVRKAVWRAVEEIISCTGAGQQSTHHLLGRAYNVNRIYLMFSI